MAVTHEQISKAIRAAPFQPFRLHLADQREFDVRHPEFAWLHPRGRSLIVIPTDNEESFELLDIALVVSITVLGPPSSGSWAA